MLNALSNFQHQQHQYQQQQQQQQQQIQQQQQLQQQQTLANQQVESIEANKGYTFEEQFKQLYELSDDPKRKEFLDDLFQFMADRNQPVNRIPIMAKHVLDLYELYNLVVARGGLVEVINKKIWREITKGLDLPNSITSAAFTLRTQYMKYLYPYECAKNNFSNQEELQQAIDGNRREGRRAGNASLPAGYAPFLGPGGVSGGASANNGTGAIQSGDPLSRYSSASPSPNHLFAAHNLLSQAAQAVQQQQQQQQAAATAAAVAAAHQQLSQHQQTPRHHQQLQQHQPALHHHQQQHLLNLHHQDSREPLRPQSGSSSNASFSQQQRLYQDSIDSDHDDDESSIDLGHSSKRNSPVDLGSHQHLDPHNLLLNQQQSAGHTAPTVDHQQQQLAAAAAAAIRQQLGAAIGFGANPNFLSQLASSATSQQQSSATPTQQQPQIPQIPTPNPSLLNATTNQSSSNQQQPNGSPISSQGTELLKQQQEQLLAAIMAAANHQQQQHQANGGPNPVPTGDQAPPRLSSTMMASNAMLIAASNAPDAMAVAAAAQTLGVKGAFIILLL